MSNQDTVRSENFFEMLVSWLESLPADIKILVDMIGDGGLNMKARSLAVGTLLYIISPIDIIPEKIRVLGYIDDVMILHMALAAIIEIDSNRAEYYREKYPKTFKALDEQTDLLKVTLGALHSWLTAMVKSLVQKRYRGQSAEDVIGSEKLQEDMFDEAMAYAARVDVNPEAIQRALIAAPPSRIVALLSSGLEEEQKQQTKGEQEGVIKRLTDSSVNFRKLLSRGEQG